MDCCNEMQQKKNYVENRTMQRGTLSLGVTNESHANSAPVLVTQSKRKCKQPEVEVAKPC